MAAQLLLPQVVLATLMVAHHLAAVILAVMAAQTAAAARVISGADQLATEARLEATELPSPLAIESP
jgi:uncharacterized protein (DUF305 family)